jgi:hypothetical protein
VASVFIWMLLTCFVFDLGGCLVPNETLGAGFGRHQKPIAGVQVFQCLEDNNKGGSQGECE